VEVGERRGVKHLQGYKQGKKRIKFNRRVKRLAIRKADGKENLPRGRTEITARTEKEQRASGGNFLAIYGSG